MRALAVLGTGLLLFFNGAMATAETQDDRLRQMLDMQVKQEDVEREEAMLAERARLLQIIKTVEKDAEKRAQAIAEGADRSLLCSNCHGIDGNSLQADTPNLASQQPAYTLEQLQLFASGQRKNFVMQALAANFSNEDKINLSIYYASMPLQPLDFDSELAAQGKPIYDAVCFACHGTQGMGEAGFAHIAGQRQQYTINALQRYRANALGQSDPEDVARTNPRMEQVTRKLSDDDIKAVANYVTSLVHVAQ
ncbi:MAG: c-type cytochrome [Thiohalomonadaceae bacterium]